MPISRGINKILIEIISPASGADSQTDVVLKFSDGSAIVISSQRMPGLDGGLYDTLTVADALP